MTLGTRMWPPLLPCLAAPLPLCQLSGWHMSACTAEKGIARGMMLRCQSRMGIHLHARMRGRRGHANDKPQLQASRL